MSALGGFLRLFLLADQRLVDVGDYTASSDGRSDECVQLFVTPEDKKFIHTPFLNKIYFVHLRYT